MKGKLAEKAAGFYFTAVAVIAAVAALIWYAVWASGRNMDVVIILALIIGIVADILLVIKDNDYLKVFATAVYSVAVVKLLTDSVGSFVDALQGINMFGDATQVQTIIQMSLIMALSVLASILAGFFKQSKE